MTGNEWGGLADLQTAVAINSLSLLAELSGMAELNGN